MSNPAPSLAGGAAPAKGVHGVVTALRRGRPTDRVRIAWDALHGLPGGRKLFSWIIGRVAPYSGSIKAEVIDLKAGYAKVKMRDRRRLRNHLRCLHAVALSNLSEFTGNLALAYSIPGDARFIVTRMNMEYFQKARGEVTAVCASAMPTDNAKRETEIVIELRDAQGVLVTRGTLFSLVGPIS
jgi:acyl-coenzyme A thioesterase PaaI-like protein